MNEFQGTLECVRIIVALVLIAWFSIIPAVPSRSLVINRHPQNHHNVSGYICIWNVLFVILESLLQ